MTDDDRLRIELDALEGAAPEGPPPRTFTSRAPRWLRIAAPVTALLAAGLFIGLGLLARLDGNRVPASTPPNANGSPVVAPTESPTGDLEWTAVALTEPDTEVAPRDIAAVSGRLIVTGGTAVSPAAWYSDDGGTTWIRSGFVVHAIPGASTGHSPMGRVVEYDGTLISVSWRMMYGVPSEMWRSSDRGTTWRRLPNPPPNVVDLAASEDGVVAVGFGDPADDAAAIAHVAIWVSADGDAWQRVADHPSFAGAFPTAVEEHDGRFVAVGGAAPEDAGPGGAAIWESPDGLEWNAVSIPAGYGRIVDVATGPEGFVAVGEALSADAAVTLWRSPDGVAWTPSTVRLASDLPAIPVLVAIGPPGVLVTSTSAAVRVALLDTWLVPPDSSLGSIQDAGYVVAAIPYKQGFVSVSTCAPPTECYGLRLAFGQPAGFHAPTPTLSGADPSSLVPPGNLRTRHAARGGARRRTAARKRFTRPYFGDN